MKEIKTEIIINAPLDQIWDTLLDFKAYSTWNPFIIKIMGSKTLHSKLVVTIKPHGQKSMDFTPTITKVSDYHLMWLGTVWKKGIFDGEHSFLLQQETNNTVRFLHSEKFSGILSSPIFAMIGKSTIMGFEQMNLALKSLCESTKNNG